MSNRNYRLLFLLSAVLFVAYFAVSYYQLVDDRDYQCYTECKSRYWQTKHSQFVKDTNGYRYCICNTRENLWWIEKIKKGKANVKK